MRILMCFLFLCFICVPFQDGFAQLTKFKQKRNRSYLYGLKDKKGKVKISPVYDCIFEKKDSKGNSYYILEDTKGFKALVNSDGKIIIKLGDYSYIGFLPLSNGYIKVNSLGKAGIFDIKGNQILSVDYDEIYGCSHKVNNEYVVNGFEVEIAGKRGLYDTHGACLIPEKYDYIDSYALKKGCRYIKIDNDPYCGIWDLKEHKEAFCPNKFTSISVIADNWFYSRNRGDSIYLYNNQTEVFRGIGDYIKKDNDCFRVYYGGGGAFYQLNSEGKMVTNFEYLPKTYKYISKDSSVKFCYFSDENCKRGVKSLDGNVIIPCNYDEIVYEGYKINKKQHFALYNKTFQGICDLRGKVIIAPDRYNSVTFDTEKRFYVVTLGGYKGIVDTLGNEILPPNMYQEIEPFSANANLFRVEINGKYGVVDKNWKELIPCLFKTIKLEKRSSIGQYFKVLQNGKYGLFSINGKCIVPPMYTEVSIHDANFYFNYDSFSYIETKNYQFCGVYDLNGNKIIPAEFATQVSFCGKLTDLPYFCVTDALNRVGLIDLSGKTLFPFSEFKYVGINKDTKSSTGYSVMAMEDIGGRTVVSELYTGVVMSDNKEEVDLRKYITEGDSFFNDRQYKKAVSSYTEALKIKKLDYVLFNRGLAFYNQSKYNDAISDFRLCKSMNPDLERGRVDNLIETAIKLQEEKERKTAQIMESLLGLAFSVYDVATLPKKKNSNYSPSSSSFSSNRNSETNVGIEGSSSNNVSKAKKECGFCGGRGFTIEYTSNFGINEQKYCDDCGKNVSSGHYHKTCSRCKGSGMN